MKNVSSIFVFFLFSIFTMGQEKKLESTLLWEISGNGLNKPSYLFGTFHMLCAKDFQFPEKLNPILNKVDEVYTEINLTDPNEIKKFQKLVLEGKKLKEEITDAQKEKLVKGLKDYQYEFKDLENFSASAANSLLVQKNFDCNTAELKLLDLEILMKALKLNKQLNGLETVEEQMEFYNKFITPDDFIYSATHYDKLKQESDAMVQYYKQEQLTKLYNAMVSSETMNKEKKEIILDIRNENWAKKIPDIIKDKQTLFAVGSGHLAGEKGIIQLLRNLGYHVNPVLK